MNFGDSVPTFETLYALILHAVASIDVRLLAGAALPQLVAIAGSYLCARLMRRRVHASLQGIWQRIVGMRPGAVVRLRSVEFALLWLMLQWFALVALREAGVPFPAVQVVVSLLVAWIAVRLAASLIASVFWSRVIAVCFVIGAALKASGLWQPTLDILGEMAVSLGTVRITMLGVIEATLIMVLLWSIATAVGNWLDRWAERLPGFSPSGRVLLGKAFRVGTMSIAVIVALHALGVDVTTLAVFSGALGLGIGFGLQKVSSNLISGMILLLDRSVKPGDVIAVDGRYGWINVLGARYVSVVTRDGVEYLIPNEELISSRVENWSHSNNLLRLHVPFGVAYGSPLRTVVTLAEESARETPRVLLAPAPECLLTAFADSSVNFELRFWISDPRNGVHNVKSAVLMLLSERCSEQGIQFPFPQRDLHLKTPTALPVRLVHTDSEGRVPGCGDLASGDSAGTGTVSDGRI